MITYKITGFFTVLFIFNLLLPAEHLYSQFSVSGHVYYSDNNAPVQNDVAYMVILNSDNSNVIVLDSSQINPEGGYCIFTNYSDSVLICIGLLYRVADQDHITTYYSSTIDWQKADKVDPTGNPANIDIYVKRISPPSGDGTITGSVTTTDINQNIVPVQGAIVLAAQVDNFYNAVYTDAQGNFSLDSLINGTYSVLVTKIGFELDSSIVSTSGGLSGVNIHINKVKVNYLGSTHQILNNFCLFQNYPNPFNPVTSIKFIIPDMKAKGANVKLVIYDILGREVAVLVDKYLMSGKYEIKWDGSKYTSGIYFYRLTAGNIISVKRMVLLK